MSDKPLTGIIIPPPRDEGPYWVKPGPGEPWEVMFWDAHNDCWWVFSNDAPWQTPETLIIGPKAEPPND